MKRLTARRVLTTCTVLALLLFLVMIIALKVGAVPISVTDLTVSLVKVALGQMENLPSQYSMIVLELRLPRILLGILVGASLAVAGSGFQALLRNPLADPYVLGVSSGAAVGALLSLILGARSSWATPAAAFAGALLTITAVYFLGRRGGVLDSYTLLLGGIITASFFSAAIIFLMSTLRSGDLRGMAFWLMGDLSTPSIVRLDFLFIILLATIAVIYTTAGDLNLLLTGEQEAVHMGVEVGRVKLVVYLGASLLTGLAVSVSGAIGFVGLLVPHAMRLLVGSDYRILIPASAFGGAIAVVAADTVARTIVFPTEVSVGAVTALAGAPVFLYLLRWRMR